ncbi:ComEA family DNA-binding protein [Streptomyces sp. RKND-216]|uniref:ComEA family DNA-binding protein n=1 Tax=Streptomyces sp. RKND-216 TaxID=2562581 RepID=UPI001FFB92BC|nr:ComEA family DNA-binding protein [Streptomyces sp. RKND-216]
MAVARAAVAAARERGRPPEPPARPDLAPPVPEAGPHARDADPPTRRAAPDRSGADDPEVPETASPSLAGRLREAFLERLPLWVQLRCAVEPKTLAALGLVLLVALGFAVHHFLSGRPQTVAAPRAAAEPLSPPSASPDAVSSGVGGPVVVDVAGDVREPGVHRLPRGSRVADALKAAGGVRPGTDPKQLGGLNQARRLVDGEQILVGEIAARAVGGPVPAPAAGVPPGAGGTPARISLSSATTEQLETLPGVGPVLAGHIVDYRTEHGGFTSIEQLREVDGIGPARFADLRPRVGP